MTDPQVENNPAVDAQMRAAKLAHYTFTASDGCPGIKMRSNKEAAAIAAAVADAAVAEARQEAWMHGYEAGRADELQGIMDQVLSSDFDDTGIEGVRLFLRALAESEKP